MSVTVVNLVKDKPIPIKKGTTKNITKQSKNNNEFQKILMAHSFTWWGVQTMNIYMFFYISTKITGLSAEAMASTNSWAFLVRDLVGAILPVLVLNVIAKKTGMTRRICNKRTIR